MSKKKNVRRKKSNNLLKGVAAAGAVVGGGTIFAGNNAVYAAENDQAPMGVQSQSEEQYIESQSASQSQTTSYTDSESDVTSYSDAPVTISVAEQVSVPQDELSTEDGGETVVADQNSVGTNVESKEEGVGKQFADALNGLATLGQGNITTTAEGQNKQDNSGNSTFDNESVSLSVSGSMSGSLSEVGSQISQESVTASKLESETISASASTSASTSAFVPESQHLSTSTSQSTSNEVSKYTSESASLSAQLNSTSLAFNEKKNDTLETLIENINASKARLQAIRQNAIDNNVKLDQNNSKYCDEADNLAMLLAKYYFYQTYGIGDITEISKNYNHKAPNNQYERNNFSITFVTSGSKEVHVGYFDWVAVTVVKDENQNPILKDGKLQYKYVGYTEVPASDVVQIAVIKKAPIYSNPYKTDDYGNKQSFYYYEDANGKHFKLTELVQKKVLVYHKGQPRYIDKNEYQYKDINDVKIISEDNDNIIFEYNGNTYNLTVQKSTVQNGDRIETFPYFGEVPDDLHIKNSGEGTTIKGKYYFSITDFDNKEGLTDTLVTC